MTKHLSIRTRVTLYYSLALILLALLLSGVVFFTSLRQVTAVSHGTIMRAVQNAFDDVESGNGFVQIDSDFDAYYQGVTLLVYDENGVLLKGNVPRDFPVYTPLSTDDYKEVETEDATWLVYDLYNTYENGQGIWIRGIYAMENALETMRTTILILLIALPVLLLAAILAGRYITRQAFAPVSQIAEAADSINNGNDLTKRLPQGEARDELSMLTETLNRMIQRLEDAFQAEKEFSSDVSHELKTPLSVMLAECEYLLQAPRTPEVYQESLQAIQKQCGQTLALIQQLLQMSRTIDRDSNIEREMCSLSVLCESVLAEMALVAEEQGIVLTGEICPDVTLYADETLLLRMLINLLSNAIKYSKPDGYRSVRLVLTVEPAAGSDAAGAAHAAQKNAVVSVEDNGIGIRPHDLDQIFHRFYKVDKSRSGDGQSFGLGLSMVQWIAQVHGGTVTAESTYGIGSRFTVTLPLTATDGAAPPETAG